MPESTLSVTLDEVRQEVCRMLGFGRNGYDTMDVALRDDVDAFIRRGLRQFYAPMPLPGESTAHRWSFLVPNEEIVTVAGSFDYDLPEDFQSLEGDLFIAEQGMTFPVRTVSESAFRASQQGTSPVSGRPRIACVYPSSRGLVPVVPDNPTRWKVDLYPTPDAAYRVRYRYHTIQDAPSDGEDSLPGGMLHGETIIASCLAVAEAYGQTPATRYRDEFVGRLAASVALDRSRTASQFIGSNADRSDDRNSLGRRHGGDYVVKYEGVSP
jgi:hypothetical protein